MEGGKRTQYFDPRDIYILIFTNLYKVEANFVKLNYLLYFNRSSWKFVLYYTVDNKGIWPTNNQIYKIDQYKAHLLSSDLQMEKN